ncbi:MAG: sulfotransferase [Gammaproteobacteria bacterium]|nr:sulfotransferase [Gammaproteobacteria bacterium]
MNLSESLIKVNKTLRYHQQRLMRELRAGMWQLYPARADRPIFVVGCSRAGTTLVYKTFSASRELGTLNRETHDFWIGMHPLAQRGWLTHALGVSDAAPKDRDQATRYFYAWTGKRRWVDKNNQNGLCVPYLHALFPDAYFVYVKRGPGDNINSLIEGWGKEGKFSTWSAALPVKVAIENGQYTRWCFFLSEGWQQYVQASIEEVAAFQYRAVNHAILAAKAEVPPNQWVEIFYEDLVRDPVAGFRNIFESCGLSFDAEIETHCRNVLDTPYDAFGEIKLDKWREGRNSDRIKHVLPLVANTATAMGYPVV